MAISPRLSRTLHQELGDEAAEDLVNWMTHMETNRSELRVLMDGYMDRIDRRFDKIDQRFENVDRRFIDLYKWSFVFWCGAVGAIAALARVLR